MVPKEFDKVKHSARSATIRYFHYYQKHHERSELFGLALRPVAENFRSVHHPCWSAAMVMATPHPSNILLRAASHRTVQSGPPQLASDSCCLHPSDNLEQPDGVKQCFGEVHIKQAHDRLFWNPHPPCLPSLYLLVIQLLYSSSLDHSKCLSSLQDFSWLSSPALVLLHPPVCESLVAEDPASCTRLHSHLLSYLIHSVARMDAEPVVAPARGVVGSMFDTLLKHVNPEAAAARLPTTAPHENPFAQFPQTDVHAGAPVVLTQPVIAHPEIVIPAPAAAPVPFPLAAVTGPSAAAPQKIGFFDKVKGLVGKETTSNAAATTTPKTGRVAQFKNWFHGLTTPQKVGVGLAASVPVVAVPVGIHEVDKDKKEEAEKAAAANANADQAAGVEPNAPAASDVDASASAAQDAVVADASAAPAVSAGTVAAPATDAAAVPALAQPQNA